MAGQTMEQGATQVQRDYPLSSWKEKKKGESKAKKLLEGKKEESQLEKGSPK